MNETYLVHHGVVGMKWGVRKATTQNQERKKKVSVTITKNPYRRVLGTSMLLGGAVLAANSGNIAFDVATKYITAQRDLQLNNLGVLTYAASHSIPMNTKVNGIGLGVKEIRRARQYMDAARHIKVGDWLP